MTFLCSSFKISTTIQCLPHKFNELWTFFYQTFLQQKLHHFRKVSTCLADTCIRYVLYCAYNIINLNVNFFSVKINNNFMLHEQFALYQLNYSLDEQHINSFQTLEMNFQCLHRKSLKSYLNIFIGSTKDLDLIQSFGWSY